jgi:chromate transporter
MSRISLSSLFLVFTKLGTTSFGGPLAHIALMDHELVQKRQWISRERFLHLHALTQLIPGPNSTELAMLIGRQMAGMPGLIVASLGFILPAFFCSTVMALFYMEAGHLPIGHEILRCVRPIILAIILRALYGFARQLPNRPLWIVGSLALAAKLLGLADLLILFLGGLVLFIHYRKVHATHSAFIFTAAPPVEIFAVFFKIGAVLFGSGYTLLLYLQDDLVHRLGWLTEAQVLDAITVGQITPGPLFTSASFIGFILQGWTGAGLATLGIFGTAFLMIACSAYLLPRLERLPELPHVLLGVNAAAMGLMVHVCYDLVKSSVTDFLSVALAGIAFVLLEKVRIDAGLLIILGITVGFASYLL